MKKILTLAIVLVFLLGMTAVIAKQDQENVSPGKEKNTNNAGSEEIGPEGPGEEPASAKTNNSNRPAVIENFKNSGQETAAAHRSVVANTVQNLLRTATEDTKIGPQVKAVAIQQSISAETTAQAMEKIEKRSKIKTFLAGADYKNLGALRSEYVQTRNRIRQLTRLMNQSTDVATKTALTADIETLNAEMNNLNTFITTNSDKFSLFGWFTKLFYPNTTESEI